jgi:ASC-1-like (ASCH) protein
MDLYVQYNDYKCVIEIKLWHYYDSYNTVLEEGLEQLTKYRDTIDAALPAYLVIFDRRSEDKKAPWDERISWNDGVEGITVLGC